MSKITGEMYVEDIVSNFPDTVGYLMERDIICIKCGAPVWGTLNELLESRGVKDKENFILKMNDFLDGKE
ncbi:MAG: DUF1858 domain-containing protein [bacterium]